METFKPRPDKETDMVAKLGPLLFKWLETFRDPRTRSRARSMTLIILTDGCWKGMINTDQLEDLIVQFNNDFKKVPGAGLLQRYVSIQFISFGDDRGALGRLRHLDNDLVFDRSIDDIIDTESWTGDVYKMLLGSLVPDIDRLDEESEEEIHVEPSTTQRHDPRTPRQSEQNYPAHTPRQSEHQFQTNASRPPEQQHQTYTPRQSDLQYRTSTSQRRERYFPYSSPQTSNLNPRSEQSYSVSPPAATDPFVLQQNNYRQSPAQRDALGHYRYPS